MTFMTVPHSGLPDSVLSEVSFIFIILRKIKDLTIPTVPIFFVIYIIIIIVVVVVVVYTL